MPPARFSPGFRLSALDALVLAAATVGVAALASMEWWWGLVVGIPVSHFFLFCNVFRVSRVLELVWAGAFLALAGATIVSGVPGWGPTAVVSACVAALVVAAEMRKPSYHGVGWRRVNPGLPAWWEAHGPRAREPSFARATPAGRGEDSP